MSLPAHLDPSSSEVGFSGNIASQCANGTFPECRPLLVRQLAQEVAKGYLEQAKADKRLADADALWEKSIRNADVAAKADLRFLARNEREQDLCRACSNQVAELRGVPVDSLASVIVEVETARAEEHTVEEPVRRRGRPRK